MNNNHPRNGIMGVSGYTAFPEIGRPQPASALTLEMSLRVRRKRKVDFMDFMFPPLQQARMIADDPVIDFSQIRPRGAAFRSLQLMAQRYKEITEQTPPRRSAIADDPFDGGTKNENPCRDIVPREYWWDEAMRRSADSARETLRRWYTADLAARHLHGGKMGILRTRYHIDGKMAVDQDSFDAFLRLRCYHIGDDDLHTEALRKLSYAQKAIAADAAANVRDAGGDGGPEERPLRSPCAEGQAAGGGGGNGRSR